MRQPKVVYDIGVQEGEDTAFYLSRGCRVVGVEANPILVDRLRTRFASEIAAGQFVLDPKEIAEQSGTVRFVSYPNATIWARSPTASPIATRT